jgi:hypothetical protein
MELESEFVSLAKPELAWDNHKIPTSYTWVLQGLVLKYRAIFNIGWMNRMYGR